MLPPVQPHPCSATGRSTDGAQTRGRDTSPPPHSGVSLRQLLLSPSREKTFIIMTAHTHTEQDKTMLQLAMCEDDSIASYITHTVHVFQLNNNIMSKNIRKIKVLFDILLSCRAK
ncbi:hypothetical protein ATANTOWER_010667 [Ataeniobius toweri]|uniref:Uncharacterized protein n=1 Tax=Ataeniobius toweri TaxID=208326 RepID=A0ABU7CBX8_9TELE|nr:hypothetical protein [Ataeniobius toweri]